MQIIKESFQTHTTHLENVTAHIIVSNEYWCIQHNIDKLGMT